MPFASRKSGCSHRSSYGKKQILWLHHARPALPSFFVPPCSFPERRPPSAEIEEPCKALINVLKSHVFTFSTAPFFQLET